MTGFEYPNSKHSRRHGPRGYKDYESYRQWLRDEFLYRCVYCLQREQWWNSTGMFHIDHFRAVATEPDGRCEYSNLIYACVSCNLAKQDVEGIPNPCEVAFHECVRITEEGRVEALNEAGEKLKKLLRLDSDRRVEKRFRWMRNLRALELKEPDLYREYMSFPTDLPDLRDLRPPKDDMPTSAANCHYALRERGELPETY